MWKLRITNPKGEWVLAVLLVILFVRFSWTFEQYVSRVLNVPHADVPGDDNAPFYFMRQDVVNGICAGAGMALSVILVALTWKHYRRYSSMALFMAWIWCMPWVVNALIVYWRSSHLMDARRATSEWKTFDEYMNDPLRRVGFWVSLLAGIALALVLRKRYGWNQPDEKTGAGAVNSAS